MVKIMLRRSEIRLGPDYKSMESMGIPVLRRPFWIMLRWAILADEAEHTLAPQVCSTLGSWIIGCWAMDCPSASRIDPAYPECILASGAAMRVRGRCSLRQICVIACRKI